MRLSLLCKAEEAHEDAVWSCAWAGGNTLVTGSVDERVKRWEEANGRLEALHTYTGHTLGVVSVAVDQSGTYAASSALDSVIRVWNLKDSSTQAIIETEPSETWSIAFAPTSDKVIVAAAGGSTNKVKLWEAAEGIGTAKAELDVPAAEESFKKERFVLSVAYSPDGTKLASGSMDGTVCLWDVASAKLLLTLTGHFKPVRALTFTPDSKMLLTACDDMHTHLYDATSGSLIEAFSGHESWVLGVTVHPTGTSFATCSSDTKVKLWDMQTRACVQTVSEHTDQVWDVKFREDGLRLATVSDDKSVAVFDYMS